VRRLALALTLALAACGPRAADVLVADAIHVANVSRLSIETAETAALVAYKAAQMDALERAKLTGKTHDEAVRDVFAVRGAWAPVWPLVREARRAQALLVAAIEAERSGMASAEDVARKLEDLIRQTDLVARALAEKRTAPE